MNEFGDERGSYNRCSLISSIFDFSMYSKPQYRSLSEKFQVECKKAAIELGMNETSELFDFFYQHVVEKAKTYETLNAGALALVYVYCFGGNKINIKKTADFLKTLPTNKFLKKFINEYGITPQDLIRYVRFCKIHF